MGILILAWNVNKIALNWFDIELIISIIELNELQC